MVLPPGLELGSEVYETPASPYMLWEQDAFNGIYAKYAMRMQEILAESTPRTLYHGTLKRFVPDILDLGLLPQVGAFTAHAYDEYRRHGIPLDNVVFAADRQGLGKCISAIIGQMRQVGMEKITMKDFYANAALLVIKRGERRFQRRPEDDIVGDHPHQAEPGDYYTRGADYPDIVLTGDRLRGFLRRNGVRLDDYGIPDEGIDRAELIRRKVLPPPAR